MYPVRFRTQRLIKLGLIVAVLLVIYLIFWPEEMINENDPDSLDFFTLPVDSYGLANDRNLIDLTKTPWPTFQGYNDKYANKEDNPADYDLFDRIQFSQKNLRSPTFHLKGERRHQWQFEKIIHQTWKSVNIPDHTASWVGKWLELNPDWTLMFWTDESQSAFIKTYYPELSEVYESWTLPVQKADMFRYVALYAFGGVYADLDMENRRPLEGIRNWASCILSREPDPQVFVLYPPLASWANNWTFTGNAFIACQSHHPFLHYLIARTVQNSPVMRGAPCPLGKTLLCTGPWMMSFAYTFYKRSIQDEVMTVRPEWNVVCPDYEFFLPTYDPSRAHKVKRDCMWMRYFGDKRQKAICGKERERYFRNSAKSFSFTKHRWFGSYRNKFSRFVDVRDVARVTLWRPGTTGDFDTCLTAECRMNLTSFV